MGKEFFLSLQDVGDLIYRATQRYLFRNKKDIGIDIAFQTNILQETMIMCFKDNSHVLIKIFPHKNYSQEFVYRIEVYKTREGEMRGAKIAFLEASRKESAANEIQLFVQNFLSQMGF